MVLRFDHRKHFRPDGQRRYLTGPRCAVPETAEQRPHKGNLPSSRVAGSYQALKIAMHEDNGACRSLADSDRLPTPSSIIALVDPHR